MLITVKNSAQADEIERIRAHLALWGLTPRLSQVKGQRVLGLEKNLQNDHVEIMLGLNGVEQVLAFSTPFQMAHLSFKPQKTIIDVKGVAIGGKKIILMAGPCAIESRQQLENIAEQLKGAGVDVFRGSAFKPRSSPYSFQGMGVEGLKIHREAQHKHGMLIETEVMDVRDIEVVIEHVDIVRIGARNMQNFNLLKEVGGCGKPVILKRGTSATIEEWLLSAEYLMAHGNADVILCERGIRTFENATRSTLDLSSVAVVKTISHLPVIVDPSHAAGRKDIIPALSKAAIAAGADGLLIEVHDCPQKAKCDGMQALLPSELSVLAKELQAIAQSMGRFL